VNNLLTEIYLKYTLYSKFYVNIYVGLLVEIKTMIPVRKHSTHELFVVDQSNIKLQSSAILSS